MRAHVSAPKGEIDPIALEAHLAPWRLEVDAVLERLLPERFASDSRLLEAMRYAVLAGPGKRFRPLLCVLAAEACGGSGWNVLPTACAIELLHACSLVHDDLPAMDAGLLRRGLPSCHVQFGEALAILVGDALLAMAFELVARQDGAGVTASPPHFVAPSPERDAPGIPAVSPDRVVAVLAVLTRAIGPLGLSGGQAADLQAEGREIDAAMLESIHARKTGSLIHAAVTCGALLAGADSAAVAALARYGGALGQLYQIVDDLLSETGDVASIGKDPGSDRARRKATYPRLYGLEGARQAADGALSRALEAVSEFDQRAESLRALARFARGRQR